jgi:hypothetical protein
MDGIHFGGCALIFMAGFFVASAIYRRSWVPVAQAVFYLAIAVAFCRGPMRTVSTPPTTPGEQR